MISVVTPCFNQSPYLSECLQSLISQTLSDWECILVDDGSTDGSYQVAQRIAQKEARLCCYQQSHQGPSAARNHAVAFAHGEWLLPLDADDRLAPTSLEKLLNAARQNPSAKVIYGKTRCFGTINKAVDSLPYSYESLLKGNLIPATALLRRSDFLACGGYDETMRSGWEDWDFWLSLLGPEDQVLQLDEELFYYRRHPGSRNDSLTDSEMIALRKVIYEKHFENYRAHFEDPLNLAYRVKMLEREVRHLQNRDLITRIRRRLKSLFSKP